MRGRLVLLTVAVTAMVVTAFSLPLGLLVRDLARDRALAAVQRETNSVARTLAVLTDPTSAQIVALVDGRSADVELSIVTAEGDLLGAGPVDLDVVARARRGSAVSVPEAGGEALYLPVVGAEGVAQVVRGWVGPSRLSRNVGAAWAALGGLAILLIGLSAWLADRLGRSLVRPVETLAAAADDVGSGALDVSVEPGGPAELRAVGHAFNRLVQRVGDLVASEREEVADLSHRLRTPLAALRLDAEALGEGAAADNVRADVEYLERSVDRLIDEARRPIRDAGGRVSNLGGIVEARSEYWAPLVAEQDRPLSVDVPAEPVPVDAATEDLEALIDALVANVVAHTPEGTALDLTVRNAPVPVLIIEDRGPGFADLGAVERGVSGTGGTGLGLDIVRRTAERFGGGVELENRAGGGARVVVRLGPRA